MFNVNLFYTNLSAGTSLYKDLVDYEFLLPFQYSPLGAVEKVPFNRKAR
jgi:hypothetical protein